MKHLISYKIFEELLIDDLVETLEDITLDLQDDGFVVRINRTIIPGYPRKGGARMSQYIRVSIGSETGKTFAYSDISSVVDRMSKFMDQHGCKRDDSYNTTGVMGSWIPTTKFHDGGSCEIYYKL